MWDLQRWESMMEACDSEQLWMWAASRLSLKSVNVFICHGIFTKSLKIRNILQCMYTSWSFHHDLGCRFHYTVQLQRFAEPEGPVVNGSSSACSAYGDSNSTNHGEVNQPKPKLACRRSPDKLPSKMSRTSVFFMAFVWGESKKSHIWCSVAPVPPPCGWVMVSSVSPLVVVVVVVVVL